jgi:hypothetical protein
MKKNRPFLSRIHHNFCENLVWFYQLWYDKNGAREKLYQYYRWHYKEMLLCVFIGVLLTRVDKVQQFFSAFSNDIKYGESYLSQFILAFGLNSLVIFWLCYVLWHKPAKLYLGKHRLWITGDRRREDFDAYYKKPGNSWRVSLVSSIPMLLVSGTLSLSLLRDDPLKLNDQTPTSAWIEDHSMTILFGLTILYLIIGSLIRPITKVIERTAGDSKKAPAQPEPSIKKIPWLIQKLHCEDCLSKGRHDGAEAAAYPNTTEGLDKLLGSLWNGFRRNLVALIAVLILLGLMLWNYRSAIEGDVNFNYLRLLVFSLSAPLAVSFFLNSFSECLIIESQKKVLAKEEEIKHESKFSFWYDALMWTSYVLSGFIFYLSNNRSVTSSEAFSKWMFPIAMLLFILIFYYQVLDLLIYNFTKVRFYTIIMVLFGSVFLVGQREHYQMKFKGEVPASHTLERTNLEDYFLSWVRDRYLSSGGKDTMDVYMVAAEGGGSRAGAWTCAVLTALDSMSHGQFRRQCFAISGVSGGALGGAATLALWDNANLKPENEARMYQNGNRAFYLKKIFQRNYISTSLAGIFFYDFIQQMTGTAGRIASRMKKMTPFAGG